MKPILAAILFLAITIPGYAQPSFGDVVQTLNKAPLAKRSNIARQYMAKLSGTPVIEGNDKVHFVWFGKADTVKIEGELQRSWAIPQVMTRIDCGEENFFYYSYTLPADAYLEYRFIVDNKASLDRRNTRVSQGFDMSDRNYFFMPAFKELLSAKPRYDIEKGILHQLNFKTEHKPFTNQPVWVYIPHGYTEEKKYPVLYVYDGVSTLYNRPLLNVVNNLIHDKKIEPIVLVFVGFEDRWTEYVSESIEWAKLMKEELVPFIEKNVSVEAVPEKRGVLGASASGHGAFITALQHPEVFGNVASQGGGGGGYPGLNPIANKALDGYLAKKDKTPLRKIYTEVGSFDLEFPSEKIVFSDGVDQFNKRLKENGIEFVSRKVNGGHNSAIWNQSLEDILVLFYGK